MNNMKIDSFRRFFNLGIWDKTDLEYLKSKGVIKDKDVKEITIKPRTLSNDPRVGGLQYEYEIWDKISPINGVEAKKFIVDSGLEHAEEIVLVKLGNRIIEVSDVETLRINHNINLSAQAEDVAELHTMHLEEVKNTPNISIEEINTATTYMSELKKQDELTGIKGLLIDIKDLLIDIKNILIKQIEGN